MRLPSAYQEVTYIQSSGTQYIDTGYIVNSSTKVEADIQFTGTTNQRMVFGIGSDTNTSSGVTFCIYIGGGGYWSCGMGNGVGTGTWSNSTVAANTDRNKFVLSNGKFEVYGSGGTKVVDITTTNTISSTATHSMGIFSRYEMAYNSFRNLSSGKLYSFKIYEGNSLVRDFVPCYRKSDNVIGLYDLVNNQFYTNAGTGVFTKGPDFKGGKISKGYLWVRESNIPSEYQEVEYIESSGTQWIDTGITATQNTKSQIKVRPLGVTGATIYGYCNTDDNADYRLFNYNSQIYWDMSSYRAYGSTFSANNDYEFEIGNNYVKNIGASTNLVSSTTVSSYTSAGTIKLNYHDHQGQISSNRRYYVKIWDGDTQVSDLIPCYRKSDNVIGMYDKVGGEFYTNQGSGTFAKGSDVAPTYVSIEKQFYPGVPPTPPGPSYTTILDVDFTNTTDSALTSLGFRSIGVNYGLRSETGTGLRWVNYQTDVAAGVEFDYADSLVGKILAWECEVYCGRFDIWGNVNLNISNPRNYSNMSDRYSNLANFGMTGLPGFNSNQYTGVNGGGYWDPTNGSIEGDKSGGLYWDNYGTYHLGLPFTTGTYKMTGSYNFSTWQFTNTWETPNGTLSTWTRDFSACTAAQKTIMNNFLATTNKQFILQESRGYGNGTGYDVNYRRKLKIKVA